MSCHCNYFAIFFFILSTQYRTNFLNWFGLQKWPKMCWMLDNIFFFITLYIYSLSSDLKKICQFCNDKFFGLKLMNGKLSNLPIWPLEIIFLLVLFRPFSICQRHFTSYSLYRSPCGKKMLVPTRVTNYIRHGSPVYCRPSG